MRAAGLKEQGRGKLSMATILVIDDQEEVRDIVSLYFEDEFVVITAEDGISGIEKVGLYQPDLIILDLMLPGMNGWEVCKTLRKETNIPIIMLTAKGEEIDRILGLELGADDYVTKPFSPRELLARAKAVMRRAKVNTETTKIKEELRFPSLIISHPTYQAKVNDQIISLTAKEFELLWYLASNPGRVYSREQLLENIWGYDYFGDTRNVDAHIKRIRKKLEVDPLVANYIVTVWGVGYKFEVTSC